MGTKLGALEVSGAAGGFSSSAAWQANAGRLKTKKQTRAAMRTNFISALSVL
jgi:hypothetical protein